MGVDGIEDGFGQLVQESGRQTGWRDAPGEERQSVTFRREGAYRRRAQSGLVHTMIGTAANVSDVTQAQALLHGDETDAFGDAGYQGVEKRAENQRTPGDLACGHASEQVQGPAGDAAGRSARTDL